MSASDQTGRGEMSVPRPHEANPFHPPSSIRIQIYNQFQGRSARFEGVRARRMYRAPKALQTRVVWGHALQENF